MTAVTVTTLTSIAARFERATRFAARRFARVPMLAAALVGSSGVTLTSVAWAQSGGLPLPSSQAVSSVPSVGQILQQAASAASSLNYSGTITYQRRGAVETSRIVHLFENGVEMERITTLDGPPYEVIRVNDELTCYLPEARLIRIEPRTGRQGFPSLLPKQMATLAQQFTVKKLEIERVAGHDAQVWMFEPNDEFRFWHKLWTELKTGLWLRGRVLDESGKVIEEITFSDIRIGGRIDREQLKPTLVNNVANWRVDRKLPINAVKTDTGWVAKLLPAGFVKIGETFMRALPGRTEPVSQLVYSDGLTSVSVYAAPLAAGESPTLGASVQGSHQVFTRQANDQLITAFGDARPAAVKAIANSLARK
ncbi:MAG TPA: MucB/RseB C-terminal domain-containing protein [Casimicrobium huifangae]|uniref:MucB/RseB C-terminal domain-containing protein n=1 Tax=Casimicrobium huifangae TaxID=2591109 RepID=UPI0012EC8B6B|nr:MucB/RseB C-terminal domain-containing protein [Casimicrobium huifangae]HOB02695.1 MucB/RseB C-terminal domain-containing protein [Casimicrobium huifangae]HQA35075.1 MucB/RseB C-terminal domain-containing protein [Casimicrobium huifangae]HQD66280.1 MucB/RseB C-terminal domain-containing protein [Casimicrobium huifangae]